MHYFNYNRNCIYIFIFSVGIMYYFMLYFLDGFLVFDENVQLFDMRVEKNNNY